MDIKDGHVTFNLMQNIPKLDIDTLNYVYDRLWRFNYTNEKKNERQRAVYVERINIMKMLEELAEMALNSDLDAVEERAVNEYLKKK